MGNNVFAVHDGKTWLNGHPFLTIGLRCSNALVSDEATGSLVANLDTYSSYGVNAVSVFFQGSRFGDVRGYLEDASLSPVHAQRMGRITEAADARAMVVLVGCLYWGNSRGKWESWTQQEANLAVANTLRWLQSHDYGNVFVDVDNEGMALTQRGFDNRQMVLAAKAVDVDIPVATNFRGDPPPEADLAIHFSNEAPGKPYIETEGSPPGMPSRGGYWGPYSKREGLYGYLNVGMYTEAMKASQIAITRQHLDAGKGYMLASSWLQAGPPQGPNHEPGGQGSPDDPGILWWLEFVKQAYGPYGGA